MIDTIAYKIGHTRFIHRDDPVFIECLSKNLQLADCPCVTADSTELNDLSELFRGLA